MYWDMKEAIPVSPNPSFENRFPVKLMVWSLSGHGAFTGSRNIQSEDISILGSGSRAHDLGWDGGKQGGQFKMPESLIEYTESDNAPKATEDSRCESI